MKSLITKSRKYHQIYSNYHTVSARIVYIQYKICFAFVRNLHTCQNQYDALYRYRKIHLVTFDESLFFDKKMQQSTLSSGNVPQNFVQKNFSWKSYADILKKFFRRTRKKKFIYKKSYSKNNRCIMPKCRWQSTFCYSFY